MRPFNGLINIRILKHNIRGLPTQFKSNFLQSRSLGDFFAHGSRPSERDFIDTWVTYDGSASDFTETGYDVDCARGEPRFLDQGAEK